VRHLGFKNNEGRNKERLREKTGWKWWRWGLKTLNSTLRKTEGEKLAYALGSHPYKRYQSGRSLRASNSGKRPGKKIVEWGKAGLPQTAKSH